MRYIYKNITGSTQILNLLSEDKTSVTSIPLASNARLEVANSNLDIYVPHILIRLDEQGHDISNSLNKLVSELPVVTTDANIEISEKNEDNKSKPEVKQPVKLLTSTEKIGPGRPKKS